MSSGRRYEDVRPIPRQEAETILQTGAPMDRARTLLRLSYHDPDWRWVQDRCLELIGDDDPGVRGMAALCLGHLARIHRQLDLDRVLTVLHGIEGDPNIGWRVSDALDDIETFLGRR